MKQTATSDKVVAFYKENILFVDADTVNDLGYERAILDSLKTMNSLPKSHLREKFHPLGEVVLKKVARTLSLKVEEQRLGGFQYSILKLKFR